MLLAAVPQIFFEGFEIFFEIENAYYEDNNRDNQEVDNRMYEPVYNAIICNWRKEC